MSDTIIIASTYDRAKAHARKYGYVDAELYSINSKTIRGTAAKRIIVVDELTEYQSKVLAPCKAAGSEILQVW
jgi:hypothetical protein